MTKQEKAQAKRDRKANRDSNSFAAMPPKRDVGHTNNSKNAVMYRLMAKWLKQHNGGDK